MTYSRSLSMFVHPLLLPSPAKRTACHLLFANLTQLESSQGPWPGLIC